ncbi:hypothetical protein [uncultured Thomasclavelia sp.]|uniref:hypothetical protein n=1 Tax=uncultured Thomasclavelia sp. TaxID=3025759 RepID=UPI002600110E|nr:hypothetical protein [uncultured Thomasclavelia sp.]
MSKLRRMSKALLMETHEHRASFIVYMSLRLLVIATAILQFWRGNYENVFTCLLTLLLLVVPSFFQVTFKVELPSTLEIIILLFIFSAEILGEVNNYYSIFPQWDTMLHTINGFIVAGIGFSLVDLLNKSDRVKFELSPFFVALIAFCFSMTIGVIWEFFEFSMDNLFGMNTQKDTLITTLNNARLLGGGRYDFKNITEVIVNGKQLAGYIDIGLIDTIGDLFVNFIGAIVFSVFGFFSIKFPNTFKFLRRFIPRKKDKDKDYLKYVNKS